MIPSNIKSVSYDNKLNKIILSNIDEYNVCAYQFIQSDYSAEWVITHNNDTNFVTLQAYNMDNTVLLGCEIQIYNTNTIKLLFTEPNVGYVNLIFHTKRDCGVIDTPTVTITSTATPTPTPSITQSVTPAPTLTPTATVTSTVTPTPTSTLTPSVTATLTPSVTVTTTATPTPTITPTVTATTTATVTPTPTVSQSVISG